jgi:hypothetical protein
MKNFIHLRWNTIKNAKIQRKHIRSDEDEDEDYIKGVYLI